METININQLKKELYTAVLKTVRQKMDKPLARQIIQDKLNKQLMERAVNPNVGLMVDITL